MRLRRHSPLFCYGAAAGVAVAGALGGSVVLGGIDLAPLFGAQPQRSPQSPMACRRK